MSPERSPNKMLIEGFVNKAFCRITQIVGKYYNNIVSHWIHLLFSFNLIINHICQNCLRNDKAFRCCLEFKKEMKTFCHLLVIFCAAE